MTFFHSFSKVLKVAAVVAAVLSTVVESAQQPWPRHDDIVGYWPLGDGVSDVTGKATTYQDNNAIPETSQKGPFGEADSSYKVALYHVYDGLGYTRDGQAISQTKSFTLSAFVKTPTYNSHEISFSNVFELFDYDANTGLIQVSLQPSNGRYLLEVSSVSGTVFGTYDIIQPGDWTFFAIVFNVGQQMAIYNQMGVVYWPNYKPLLIDYLADVDTIRLGWYTDDRILYSCLMVHSVALTAAEIQQSYEACRSAHGTPPCGTSRQAFTPIPNPSSTKPQYGQFPFVVTIRSTDQAVTDKPICAAAIIGRFHLLAAASCFEVVKDSYTAHFADFDYASVDIYEMQRNIQSFTVHNRYDGGTLGDMAIIELESAIPYDNRLVNEICLPNLATLPSDLTNFEDAYFYGWGQNGRGPLQIQSYPRYSFGKIYPDVNCTRYWPNDGMNSTICFLSDDLTNMADVPCTGDEGGPLMVPIGTGEADDPERLQLVGVYGRRSSDCSDRAPLPVFSRVSTYMPQWLNSLACDIPGFSYPSSCPIGPA